jgi:hypothetical protein
MVIAESGCAILFTVHQFSKLLSALEGFSLVTGIEFVLYSLGI